MEAQSLSTCNQCGKKFQRKAHLLRHQQQHSGDRPYTCKFCSKTFKRSDVLRDHFTRCDRRGTSAIPSSLERGRKRHACDECSRLKVKCDNVIPCRKCTEFGRKCVKTRPAASTSSPEETGTQPSTPDNASDRNSIGFLLNCPEETDFLQEFPKSTTMSPKNQADKNFSGQISAPVAKSFQPITSAAAAPPTYQDYGHLMQEHNIDVLLSNLEFQTFEDQTNNWQVTGENLILWSEPGSLMIDKSVLERKAYEIREKLRYTAATQNPPQSPSAEVLDAIQLITADNISVYIKLYFRHWHKHGPMIHEATFNPCTAAIPLLLALMSLGGMYAGPEDMRKLKLLLDTIEGYIYSTPPISYEYDLPGHFYVRQGEDASQDWQQYQLEELQGAYLMIVLQYWTGTPLARTRVRQQRYPRIAAIFHHLDVVTAQHPPKFEINDPLSFRIWIRKESYIRLGSLCVMLDSTFGMFNNVPPRFQWPETDLPFPGDDDFFKISSFHEMRAMSMTPRRRMKVKDAFLLMFSLESSDRINILRDEMLTAFDMQILVHILYTFVWQNTFANPLAALPGSNILALIAPFKLAMANWKTIWDEIRAAANEEEWNKLGFQRTAETYYEAVENIVSVFEQNEGVFPPIPSDVEKGSHLKRILGFKKM